MNFFIGICILFKKVAGETLKRHAFTINPNTIQVPFGLSSGMVAFMRINHAAISLWSGVEKRSGRNSWGCLPDSLETVSTCFRGTRVHWETAAVDSPQAAEIRLFAFRRIMISVRTASLMLKPYRY
jgi:hypothetical protein